MAADKQRKSSIVLRKRQQPHQSLGVTSSLISTARQSETVSPIFDHDAGLNRATSDIAGTAVPTFKISETSFGFNIGKLQFAVTSRLQLQ